MTQSAAAFVRELEGLAASNPAAIRLALHGWRQFARPILLRSDVSDQYGMLCEGHPEHDLAACPLASLVQICQEAVLEPARACFALRPRIGEWWFVAIHDETLAIELLGPAAFLAVKEKLVNGGRPDDWVLELDLNPFTRDLFKVEEADSIGRGIEFLNRRLSSRLFEERSHGNERILNFLRLHRCRERQLLLSESIADVGALRLALRTARQALGRLPRGTPLAEFMPMLRATGFEPGWGGDAGHVSDTMKLLLDLLEAPSPQLTEAFLARVPMLFSILVVSPHGWFGQTGVLGRPDTGGQVVYILDQVRALEREMYQRLAKQGLDDIEPQIIVLTRLIPEADGTTADQRLEPIVGTRNARILRVPFRHASGEVVPHWISRFEIWPWLERFAVDAQGEVLAELGGRPDLVIGNYSDGNLVATLLSQGLGVTQCAIAHALEKTKYLLSDLYWRDQDPHYHFSCQFTADLIAMNTADFIVTSTYQEIAGTEELRGLHHAGPIPRGVRGGRARPEVQHRLARGGRDHLLPALGCRAAPRPPADGDRGAGLRPVRRRRPARRARRPRQAAALHHGATRLHQEHHRAGRVVRRARRAARAGQPGGGVGPRRPRALGRRRGAHRDRPAARCDGPLRAGQ